jgi:hypothetical protein
MITNSESQVEAYTPKDTDPAVSQSAIRAYNVEFASSERDLCAQKIAEDQRDADPRSITPQVLRLVRDLPDDADDAEVRARVRDCYIDADRQDVRHLEQRTRVYTVYYEQLISGLERAWGELERRLEQTPAARATM